jgi:septin 7
MSWLSVCPSSPWLRGPLLTVCYPGESGLGKSTLVNTLFNTSLYPPKERKGPSLDIIPKTVTIQSISADIEEAGVRLRLTVVDTPGFGDFVNNDESWRPITDNIEQRFDAYLDAENKVNRMNIVDNRIHACVFFIQPTGHSLKPLDIEVMKRLHTKVNLIPVIAKSDTLTDDEITAFKQRVCFPRFFVGLFAANQRALDSRRHQVSQGPDL